MKIETKVFATISYGIISSMMFSGLALADDSTYEGRDHEQHRHHGEQGQFKLGICVGQSLARQGIILPEPSPGQPPSQDDPSTQSAIDAAIQTCRDQMDGGSSSPTASPTASPSPDVSPVPSESPTPIPTQSESPVGTASPTPP